MPCLWRTFCTSVRLFSCRFTPDFTSSWVIRDFSLVTARGTSFPFTLNVTLPHHMLPLCAQVVPGPSWEETFWLVTIIFTWFVLSSDLWTWCYRSYTFPSLTLSLCLRVFSFSLFGVCLMACHQAQYILSEFSTPSIRSNHNPALSRDNGPVNNITPNGVKYVLHLFNNIFMHFGVKNLNSQILAHISNSATACQLH